MEATDTAEMKKTGALVIFLLKKQGRLEGGYKGAALR